MDTHGSLSFVNNVFIICFQSISMIQGKKGRYMCTLFLAVWLYIAVVGGTYQAFGVIYIGLLELFEAGEFTTSLVSTVYMVFSCIGCE